MRYRLQVAASKGISANSPPPPDGFRTQGVSTLYDADGEVRARWVKDRLDADKQEQLARAAIDGLLEPVYGKAKPKNPPKTDTKDILSLYPIADCHLGMYAYRKETGEDYDLEKGELAILGAMEQSVDSTPSSDQAIIAQLGDFLHMDDSKNVTPGSGHQLDVDTRFTKVVEVGVRALRHAVDMALEKHKAVRLIIRPGNHDPSSTPLLRAAMCGYFHNEPRVTVDDCLLPITAFQFGKTLLGFTHGDRPKPAGMVGCLSTDYRALWGNSTHCYIHHGHLHNRRVFEEQECLVECHRAITAKDRWTAEMGFRSGRDMQAITYHHETGERHRYTAAIG